MGVRAGEPNFSTNRVFAYRVEHSLHTRVLTIKVRILPGAPNPQKLTRHDHAFLFSDHLDGQADGVDLVVLGGVWEVGDFVEEIVYLRVRDQHEPSGPATVCPKQGFGQFSPL